MEDPIEYTCEEDNDYQSFNELQQELQDVIMAAMESYSIATEDVKINDGTSLELFYAAYIQGHFGPAFGDIRVIMDAISNTESSTMWELDASFAILNAVGIDYTARIQ